MIMMTSCFQVCGIASRQSRYVMESFHDKLLQFSFRPAERSDVFLLYVSP